MLSYSEAAGFARLNSHRPTLEIGSEILKFDPPANSSVFADANNGVSFPVAILQDVERNGQFTSD